MIFTSKGGLTVGRARLGMHRAKLGSVEEQTHDGDTVVVGTDDNIGVRFLGIDAPEISFTLPGGSAVNFVPISDPRWETFLSDPFAASLPPIKPALKPTLKNYLAARCGPGTATNHNELATAATQALAKLILDDIGALGETADSFAFFLAFADEVMDGYGRLLCYLNRAQQDKNTPSPRPKSYNERLLATGQVTPYFIWPNVDPYRKAQRLVDAVPKPGKVIPAGMPATSERALDEARAMVSTARQQGLGIFNPANPLRLYPFELRFLARRQPPERWLIDLSAGDNRILAPQRYHTVANPEDRLFVPEEYLPLFEHKGWKPSN